MFDLTGRTALVTGAGKGMGTGIARALKDAGANVYINDLHADLAESAAKDMDAKALPGDITNAAMRETFAEMVKDLDILVHNAGVPEDMATSIAQADKLSESHYQSQMNLNHHAVRGLNAVFLPGMRERGHGRILVITSESHRLGLPMGLTHYAAAKSATLGYMRALAAEVGPDGVTVNALSLGTMNNFPGSDRAAQSTMMGRPGSPEDAGAAALYLCSSEAAWMTGQTIPLNGGACTA